MFDFVTETKKIFSRRVKPTSQSGGRLLVRVVNRIAGVFQEAKLVNSFLGGHFCFVPFKLNNIMHLCVLKG